MNQVSVAFPKMFFLKFIHSLNCLIPIMAPNGDACSNFVEQKKQHDAFSVGVSITPDWQLLTDSIDLLFD